MEYVTRQVPVFTLPFTDRKGFETPRLSVYRGVIVHWDEDHDTRILDFIDDMNEQDRSCLVATHEHEGGMWFIWNGPAPKAYEKTDHGVDTRSGDHWSILESIELNSDGRPPTS